MENKETQVNSEQVENRNNQPTIIVKKSNNTALIWVIVIIVLLLGLTLPFHYVPSRMMMFPKNGLTFSYTMITEEDINSIITRYNNASFFEKQAMYNEPIVRKLMEKGIIVEKKDSDNSNNE